MKKRVPTAVTVVIIVVLVGVVAFLYWKFTAPEKMPETGRAGPGAPGALSEEQRLQRQLELFDKMSAEEREKYRTGKPGQRSAWKRWAEARGVPIPAEEPKGMEPRRPPESFKEGAKQKHSGP